MSRVIKCDRCGTEIEQEQEIGYISVMHRGKEEQLEGDNPFEKLDFCKDCIDAIMRFITTGPAQAAKTHRGGAARKQGATVKQTKKKVDTGKIKALADAKWTPKQIAEEMHLSTVTVNKYLNEMKAQKEP